MKLIPGYLSNINGRIYGLTNIHDNVCPENCMISGQAINLNQGTGCSISEVAERFPTVGLEAEIDFFCIFTTLEKTFCTNS